MIVLNLRGGTAIEVHPSPLMTPFLVRLLLLRQIACGGFVLPYSFVFQSIRQLKLETAGARGGARDGRPTSNVNSRIPALVMHMLCNSTGNPFDDGLNMLQRISESNGLFPGFVMWRRRIPGSYVCQRRCPSLCRIFPLEAGHDCLYLRRRAGTDPYVDNRLLVIYRQATAGRWRKRICVSHGSFR